jgi:hypothetical protein
MPRAPRQEIPGAIHHVVAKGVSGQEIVHDDHDRRALWMRLGRTVGRYRWRCFVVGGQTPDVSATGIV